MHVYVQQSSKTTLPFNSLSDNDSVLIHSSMPAKSGAAVAGITSMINCKAIITLFKV
jgi:hypothetical protein